MPQTREHLAILRLLGIERGVVALTKGDSVDAETLELARAEAQELVPGAPVVAVSARTGAGLDELRAALAARRRRSSRATATAPTRLYVDRVFTLHGIGTVVTGTLWSGTIAAGDELRVEPRGRDGARAQGAGARPAGRAGRGGPARRGQAARRRAAASSRAATRSSSRAHYPLELPARRRARGARAGSRPRVTVHLGTARRAARASSARAAAARSSGSREPLVAARGDRVVLRAGTTVGGGVVLDPAPPRHAERGAARARSSAARSCDRARARPRRALRAPRRARRARAARATGCSRARGWRSCAPTSSAARAADPLDPGVPPPPEPWAAAVVPLLGLERRGAKLYLPGAAAELGDARRRRRRSSRRSSASSRCKVDDARARALPRGAGPARPRRRRPRGLARRRTSARARRSSTSARRGRITLARFRDLLGVGRKTAQLLLERFDADGLTRRVGDERVLRRRGTIAS